MLSLCEFSSRVVAAHIAFEVVEQAWQPVPEPLQLRIAFWSFPDNEEDIRLYSCLANGAAEEFNKGENLYKSRAVKEPLQIGIQKKKKKKFIFLILSFIFFIPVLCHL